jgi:hypothetical protein
MQSKLILLLFLSAFLSAGEQQLSEDNFHIIYPESCRELATYTLNTLQELTPQLTTIFGSKSMPIRFILVNSRKEFELKTGSHLPYWTSAVTLFPQKVVVIKAPNLTHTTLRQYRKTINHELVHLVQGYHVPLNMTPTWFNEGLAVFLTDQFNMQSRVVLSRAIAKNSIIPLDRLSDFLQYNHVQAELAYTESATVIEFLTQVYGPSVLTELFNLLSEKNDFDQSLYMVTDIEPGALHLRWKKYITSRYRWIFLLDIQYIIWLIIPVLVIIAFFVKIKRNKKIFHKWNIEESNIRVE